MGKLTAKKATIKDVAAMAGVSHPTASRILNDKLFSPVRPETIARVKEAAKILNYRPNRAARTLRQQRSHIIGVSLAADPNRESTYTFKEEDLMTARKALSDLVFGVAMAGWERGYDTLMLERHEGKNGRMNREDLFPDSVDGVVYLMPSFKHQEYIEIAEAGFNLVLVGYCPPDVDIHSCDVDNKKMMARLTRHLIDRGVRNPLYVFSEAPAWVAAERRYAGFQSAMADAGLSLNPYLILQEDVTAERLHAWLLERLKKSREIDGLLFAAENAYPTIEKTLQESKLNVPGNLQVAGVCAAHSAESIAMPITSMHVPLGQLALTASHLLIDSIEGKVKKIQHLEIEPVLIER